jgi:hypothetical protein
MRKAFYYSAKDYQNATFTEKYTRVSRWKQIFYNMSGEPYFMQDGRRYKLDNFMRYGNTPTEVKAADGEKVTLAGYDATTYYKPYFVEIDESGEGCRVYQYEGSTTDYT